MKIRTDFVTNSSSSSFILGFKNEEEIENIRGDFPSYLSERVIDGVINDIMNGKISKQEALAYFLDTIYLYDVKFKGKDIWRYPYADTINPETEVGKFVKEYKDNMLTEFKKQLDEYNIISVVSYGDHYETGSLLEHTIMPCLNCTIKTISNH